MTPSLVPPPEFDLPADADERILARLTAATREPDRRPIRWRAPLAAAAAVVLVAGGAALVTHRHHDGAADALPRPSDATVVQECGLPDFRVLVRTDDDRGGVAVVGDASAVTECNIDTRGAVTAFWGPLRNRRLITPGRLAPVGWNMIFIPLFDGSSAVPSGHVAGMEVWGTVPLGAERVAVDFAGYGTAVAAVANGWFVARLFPASLADGTGRAPDSFMMRAYDAHGVLIAEATHGF